MCSIALYIEYHPPKNSQKSRYEMLAHPHFLHAPMADLVANWAWPVDQSKPHSVNHCVGNCPIHFLMTKTHQIAQNTTYYNTTWGDIFLADEEIINARVDPAVMLALKAKDQAEAARAEVEERLTLDASRMWSYAQEQKMLNSRGKGRDRHIGKVDEPCKWLYCNEKAPKHLWTKNSRGQLCAPLLQGLSGAECWAHEYHDPKSKKLEKPHTCKRLHPNEDGWRDEWDGNRLFRPRPVVVAPKPPAWGQTRGGPATDYRSAW